MSETLQFIKSFLRRPADVGAIAPSSQQLARIMVDWIDWETVKAVVEYGPGTGVFTEHIIKRLPAEAKFIAVERDHQLAAIIKDRLPEVNVVADSVVNIEGICQENGIEQVDAIICGLPWASFSDGLQQDCLDATRRVLKPGGQFATFAYWQGLLLPAAQRFRRRLDDYFQSVEKSPTAWKNIPPAFVYRCRS